MAQLKNKTGSVASVIEESRKRTSIKGEERGVKVTSTELNTLQTDTIVCREWKGEGRCVSTQGRLIHAFDWKLTSDDLATKKRARIPPSQVKASTPSGIRKRKRKKKRVTSPNGCSLSHPSSFSWFFCNPNCMLSRTLRTQNNALVLNQFFRSLGLRDHTNNRAE